MWETHEPITGFVEYGTTKNYGMKTKSEDLITNEFPIGPREDIAYPIKLAPDALVSGENVLAAGLWGFRPTGDLTLIVRLDMDDATVLNEGSPVKYIVPSLDIPDWMNPGFDDSLWSDGISGVGCYDPDDNTEVEPSSSVYVRYRFNVEDADSVKNIYLFVDYTHGYVTWLNGTEISRSSNLPDPVPSWDTLTSARHGATRLWKGMPNEERWAAKNAPDPPSTAYIHRVDLSDLTPGTEYHYRVHSAQTVSADGRFKTAPEGPAQFRFVVIGDGRTHPEMYKRVSDAALKDDPDFFIHVGDFIARPLNYYDWHGQFFAPSADLLRNTVLFPVIGNHEGGKYTATWYYKYITSNNWYSFDYGDAHFVVLDSQRQQSKAQDEWLIKDLEAHKDAKWLFISLHYQVYSSRKMGTGMRIHENWTPIFEKYGAHVVFGGHEHHYERSYRNGVYYIISGGGGANLADGRPITYGSELNQSYNPYMQISYFINQHCTIDVYENHAVLWATAPDGKVYDGITIWADRSEDT